MKVNESDQVRTKMGSLSGFTMDVVHNFRHSPLSLEQFICISTNYTGWGTSTGIRRSKLSGDVHMGPAYQAWLLDVLLSLSLPRATCWHWKNRDDRSEMCICCAIWPIGNTKDMALQPISGMRRERQDSGSAGEQWWSCFYHHLGSGRSVWQ